MRSEASALKKMGAQSFAEGNAEGKRHKAIAIAKKMLLKDSSIEEIIEITELSRAEIEAIQRKVMCS